MGSIPCGTKKGHPVGGVLFLVPLTGIEPVRILLRGILSPLCLPVPPQRRNINLLKTYNPCRRCPVAVPEKIIGLTLFLDFFDRCHSLGSLLPPPAALPSLPTAAWEHGLWYHKFTCPSSLYSWSIFKLKAGRHFSTNQSSSGRAISFIACMVSTIAESNSVLPAFCSSTHLI